MASREMAIPSALVLALVLLSACGGGGSAQQEPPPPSPSFTISVSPTTSQSNPLGVQIATSGGSITVGVTPHNGFAGTVSFSMSGLPTGVSANPPTWSLTGSQTQVVTITANGNASSGPAQAKISGSSGSRSDSAAVFLRIDPFLSATIGPAGGTLAVTDPTSSLFGLELDIPAGALTQDTYIEMNPFVDIQTAQTTSLLAILGWGVNLKPDGLELNSLGTLRIPYPDSDQDGVVDGTTLQAQFASIGTFDTGTNSWLYLSTTLDSSSRVLEAEIPSFSSKRWSHGKWLPGTITYKVANGPSSTDSAPAPINESIARALYKWTKHTRLAGITFAEVPADKSADLTFSWAPFVTPGMIVGCAANFINPIDCAGTIALTFPERQTVYFNDLLSWTTDPKGRSDFQNVEAVALHEIGHALGLGSGHFQDASGNDKLYQPPIMARRYKAESPLFNLYPADLLSLYQLYNISRPTESAYVTDQTSDSVSMVRFSDNSVSGPITLKSGSSNGPQGIAISDDRGKAYVAVYDAGSAYTIDLNSNQLWPFLPPTSTGAGSSEITVTPDSSLAFVANSLGNSVSAISLSDPRIGFTNFPITGPNGVAVTPDGKQVLVTSMTGTLAIIDVATGSESSVALRQMPEAVAIEPNGRFAYVVEPGVDPGQVEIVDLCPDEDDDGNCHGAPRIDLPPIRVGNNPLAITLLFDRGRYPHPLHHAYVSNFIDGSISVIDLNSKTVVGQITDLMKPMQPIGMALTPDGSRLYVADFGAGQVRFASTDTNMLDPTPIKVGTNPVGIVITSHPTPAPFDFGVDSFSVDGNVLGKGDPDGIPDFVDEFNDTDPLKALTEFPTSWFFFRQGVTGTDESGGFLNLRSSDGADFIGSFLRDTAELLPAPLTKGGGNSVMTAKFRAEALQPGQAYCLGVWNGVDYSEYTLICVEGDASSTTVRVHNQDGTLGEKTQVDLAGKSRVELRLDISENLNDTVTTSFKVDDGPYTIFPNTGTIFSQLTSFYAFIQGGAFVQGSLPFVSQSQGNGLPFDVNSSRALGSPTDTLRQRAVPPPPVPDPRDH